MTSLRPYLHNDTTHPAAWTPHLCRQIIILDDHSSEQDREVMRRSFHDLNLIFLYPRRKGHAHALNVAMALVESTYLLYIEDDWVFRQLPLQQNVLAHALAILTHRPHIVEVSHARIMKRIDIS
jgi:hypothetical protein